MNKTYKWKVPKSFYVDEDTEINYWDWLDGFSGELYSAVIEGLREKLGFSYNNYYVWEDDREHSIRFEEKEADFGVYFLYKKEETEALIFKISISALIYKKVLFFYRRSEPEREVFDKFHDAVIEIAKENNIAVFEEK